MSGLEVIGFVASISQLLQYSAKLISVLRDLYLDIDRCAARFRRYKQHIDHLVQITNLIKKTEILQNDLVFSQIRALVSTTEAIRQAIQQYSDEATSRKWKKAYLKILKPTPTEETISRLFEDLERDKSCLNLCVLGTYGRLIKGIESRLDTCIPLLHQQVGSMHQTLRECTGITEDGLGLSKAPKDALERRFCSRGGFQSLSMGERETAELEQLVIRAVHAVREDSVDSSQTLCSATVEDAPEDDEYCFVERIEEHEGEADGQKADGDEADEKDPHYFVDAGASMESGGDASRCIDHKLTKGPPPRSWDGMKVSGYAMQINGDVLQNLQADEFRIPCRWNSNEANGNSKQINGNVWDPNFHANFFSRN